MPLSSSTIEENLQNLIDQIKIIYSSPNLESHYLEYFKRQVTQIDEGAPDNVKKVEKTCSELGIRNVSRFYKVESDYYEWELQRRVFRLVAPSVEHLCKSVIFENTRFPHDEINDPLNSKYYCVIYVGSINTQKLMNYIRSLKNKSISKRNYNFRVADVERMVQLTGFEHKGVSPIGMNQNIPIIVSKSITELHPPVFYFGAGHKDWKLGMPILDFIKANKCFVTDLS
ncbi:308_t:CDS:2 [Diversispora eburnea]|uniref:308_t:CDS:1 n=1 Tax=Diversispora eburnea TaxID=1213867 RepID=A0A9N8ZXS7_9GLOM|nr:308_t:CDS:2 [Diversispora eburnea]